MAAFAIKETVITLYTKPAKMKEPSIFNKPFKIAIYLSIAAVILAAVAGYLFGELMAPIIEEVLK